MKPIVIEDLKNLALETSGPCISIYLPLDSDFETVRRQWESQLKHARFLLNRGREITQNFQSLITDLEEFQLRSILRTGNKSVVFFKSFKTEGYFLSPIKLPSNVIVADTFHLKPLIPEIQDSNGYNILTLSKTKLELLECNDFGVRCNQDFEMIRGRHGYLIWTKNNLETMFDFPQYNRKWLGRGFVSLKRRKTDIHRFFSFVTQLLKDQKDFSQKPLFVVGDKELIQIFSTICKKDLMFTITHPNVESIEEKSKIINIARDSVRTHFGSQLNSELENYFKMSKRKAATDELAKIAQLALVGKIKKLFISKTSEIWGTIDQKTGKITYHPNQINSRDDDVLDDIACEVIKQGGEVLLVDRKDMPTVSPVAAILAS